MAKKLLLVNRITGIVEDTVFPFDESAYEPLEYSGQIPYVVDSSFNPIRGQTIVRNLDGATASSTVLLPPQTEQKVTGTIYGTFNSGELVFQTPITVNAVNAYTSGGAVVSSYTPVVAEDIVGTPSKLVKGAIGYRCAQFMGSPVLSDPAGALVVNDYTYSSGGCGGTFNHFMVSGFLYMAEDPSGFYDPIIVTKSAGATSASTADTFLMEYDNSSKRFQLKVADAGRTLAGFVTTTVDVSVENLSSVLLGDWHHFAFAYSNSGGSACVSTYWNGSRIGQITGLSGPIRRTASPFSIGGGMCGDYPFRGYIDDLIISAGSTTAALRGIGHGTTCAVPTENQEAGAYTIAALSMDGPVGTSYFPCDVSAKILSNAQHISAVRNSSSDILYVGTVASLQESVHGLTVFAGVSGGHAVNGVCGAGPIFGYESGACCVVGSVEQLFSLSQAKNVKNQLLDNTLDFLLGVTGMVGTTGASGDFANLYSGFYTAGSMSFLPTRYNIDTLKSMNDYIVGSGDTVSNYIIETASGSTVSMSGTAVTKLYLDAVTYFTTAYQDTATSKNVVNGQTTITGVRSAPGLSRDSFVQKLAPFSTSLYPDLVIKQQSKFTKTYTSPEERYTISPTTIRPLK